MAQGLLACGPEAVFNTEGSLGTVEQFLDQRPFDEIYYMMLFSHGVESIGLPSVPQWRRMIERARRHGSFNACSLPPCLRIMC